MPGLYSLLVDTSTYPQCNDNWYSQQWLRYMKILDSHISQKRPITHHLGLVCFIVP
jgi:hypothetical protein